MAQLQTLPAQAAFTLKDDANRLLRALPAFSPIEDFIPSNIMSSLQQGAANAGKGFLQRRDVERHPYVWCFYLLKGQSITTTKQLLRIMSANNSLTSCKRVLVNMLLNTRSWMTTEQCILELLERLLVSRDPHLPVWVVACMMVHSNQVSPPLQLLPLLPKAALSGVSAAKGNPQSVAAALSYVCAPAHKLMLQAFLNPTGLHFLIQWMGSVRSSTNIATFESLFSALDLTELDILAGTTGSSALQAQAVLEVAPPLRAATPLCGFLHNHPWVHLLESSLAVRLLDLLVKQPGPHLQAATSQVLHCAQSFPQVVLVAAFLVSTICQPQALADLCNGSQSQATSAEWIVLNSYHVLMLTLERFIRDVNHAPSHDSLPNCWSLLLSTMLARAPTAEDALMRLNEQDRTLLTTVAGGLPSCSHFLSAAPHSCLWGVLVGSCLHWYLDTQLSFDGPMDAVLVPWMILRSCMQRHKEFYAPYHTAACALAPHLKSAALQEVLHREDNVEAVTSLVRQDLRYLMTVVSCQLVPSPILQSFIMTEAPKQGAADSNGSPGMWAACLQVLREGSSGHTTGQGYHALTVPGMPWAQRSQGGGAVQACLKMAQQLAPAAFLFMFADSQGMAALRCLMGCALTLLKGQSNRILLEYVQAVGDMVLSQPILRQDADVSTLASAVYSFFDDADMALDEPEEDVAPMVPAAAANTVSQHAGQAALLWAGTVAHQAVPLYIKECSVMQLSAVLGWGSVLEAAYKQGTSSTTPTSLSWLAWWLTGAAEAIGASNVIQPSQPLNAFASCVLSSWWQPGWGVIVEQEVMGLQQRQGSNVSEEAAQALDVFTHLAGCVMHHGKDLLQWPIPTLATLCTRIPQLSVQCCLACVQSTRSKLSKPDSGAWDADIVPATPPEGTSPAAFSLRASGSGESTPNMPVIKESGVIAAVSSTQPQAIVDHLFDTILLASFTNFSTKVAGAHAQGSASDELDEGDERAVAAVAAFASAFGSVSAEVQGKMRERLEEQVSCSYPSSATGRQIHLPAARYQHHMLCCIALSICGSDAALGAIGTPGVRPSSSKHPFSPLLQLALVASLCCCNPGRSQGQEQDQTSSQAGAKDDGVLPASTRWRPMLPDVVLGLEPFIGSILCCERCLAGGRKYTCEALMPGESACGEANPGLTSAPCSLTAWLEAQLSTQDAALVNGYVLQAVASRMCRTAFNILLKGFTDLISDASPLTPGQRAAAGQLRLLVQQQDIWMLLHEPQQGRAQLRVANEEDGLQKCEIILTALSQAGFAAGALKLLQWNMGTLLPCISKVACDILRRRSWCAAQGSAFVMICEELYCRSHDPVSHHRLQLMVQCLTTTWQHQLALHNPGAHRASSMYDQQRTLDVLRQMLATIQLGCELAAGPAAMVFAQQQVVDALTKTLKWLYGMMQNNSWQGMEGAEEMMLGIGEGAVTMFGDLGCHDLEVAKSFAGVVLPALARLQGHTLMEAGCMRLQGLLHKWGSDALDSADFLQDTTTGISGHSEVVPPDDGFLLLVNSSRAVVAVRIGQASG